MQTAGIRDNLSLLGTRRVCHLECYGSTPQRGRLARAFWLHAEAEEALPPALKERARHLREIELYRDYKLPLSGGVSLG